MISKTEIQAQLPYCLTGIDLPHLGEKIEGKVRDSYVLGDRRVLIASDRLSAFDVVLTTIPFKGQVLNELALYWFKATEDIIPNHIIEQPHPNVLISKQVQILPIEVIVRGYLTGSAWRDYQAGKAVSGVEIPAGMKRSARFEKPLLTPSTKAERGQHDMPISSEEIVASGIVERTLWEEVSEKAQALFARGTAKALERGLILVDTKYEFGILQDSSGKKTLLLADEVHTPDSSRYWMANSYAERFENGEDPDMLDKEFVRRQLIAEGWMGGGQPPVLSDDFRVEISQKYIDAFEKVCGQTFTAVPGDAAPAIQSVLSSLNR